MPTYTQTSSTFDSQAQQQAALLSLLHPSVRQDSDLEQQVAELSWYKEELAKAAQAEAAKDAKRKRLADQPGEGRTARDLKRTARKKGWLQGTPNG